MTLDELSAQISMLKDIRYRRHNLPILVQRRCAGPRQTTRCFRTRRNLHHLDDLPIWRNRDHFAKSFMKTTVNKARQDGHFGSSPRIKITGSDSAVGNWRLNMFGYNFDERMIMRVTGEYDIEYVRVDGQWRISSFIFKRHSMFSEEVLPDGTVLIPRFGGVSAEASVHLFGKDITSG